MKSNNKLSAFLLILASNIFWISTISAETTDPDTSVNKPSSTLPAFGNNTQKNFNKNNGEYVRKRFLQIMKKPYVNNPDNSQRKILIIGDSHAQDFLNTIVENNLLHNSQIRTRYIPTRCQIYLGEKSNQIIDKKDQSLCHKSDNLKNAKAQIAEADIIIFSALWRMWAVMALPQTITNLKLSSEQQIFVIGRRSFLTPNNEQLQNLSNIQKMRLRLSVDIHQTDINDLMRKSLDQKIFIDIHKLVCGNKTSCPVYTDRMKLISFDGGHLSKDGARYLGNILFNKSQLSTLTNQD